MKDKIIYKNKILYSRDISKYRGQKHDYNLSVLYEFTEMQIDKILGKNKTYIKEVIFTDSITESSNECNESENIFNGNDQSGITIPSGEQYIILINYSHAINKEDANLNLYAQHYIIHELTHVKTKISYKKMFKEFEDSVNNSNNCTEIYLTKLIFNEFKAEYQAQMLLPLEWDFNKYNVEANIEKSRKRFNNLMELKNSIDLNAELNDDLKNIITKLTNDTIYFIKYLLYDFSLSIAQNAADNINLYNIKEVNIVISGIETNIDTYLNQLIRDFNYKKEWTLLNNIYLNVTVIYNYLVKTILNM